MKLTAGLVLAALSAAALNWGFFAQHAAARKLPRLTLRRPVRSLRALFSAPMWLAGYLTGIAGWGLYIVALVLAPLSLVQTTSAGGIGLLAVLVSRVEGAALATRDRAGVAAALVGLALLGISLAGPVPGSAHGSLALVGVWVGLSAVAAAMSAGPGRRLLAPGAGFGAGAGLMYAAGDVATKAAVAGGARLALLGVVAACHLSAFVLLQLGFQRGGALSTAGLSSVLTNALPIAAGVILFNEALPGGILGALRVAAFLAVVIGAALLARSDGMSPEPSVAGSAGAGTPASTRKEYDAATA